MSAETAAGSGQSRGRHASELRALDPSHAVTDCQTLRAQSFEIWTIYNLISVILFGILDACTLKRRNIRHCKANPYMRECHKGWCNAEQQSRTYRSERWTNRVKVTNENNR